MREGRSLLAAMSCAAAAAAAAAGRGSRHHTHKVVVKEEHARRQVPQVGHSRRCSLGVGKALSACWVQAEACAPFPVSLVVHAGFRENLGGDATLSLWAASGLLDSFFTQFGGHGCDPVHLTFWLDALSYDGHTAELLAMLDSLADAADQLQRQYAFTHISTRFGYGMAHTYKQASQACLDAPWCRYSEPPHLFG